MSDAETKGRIPEGEEKVREDEIARLLRLAGPRPAVDTQRAERVRRAVRDRWLFEVRIHRRRFIRRMALPVAAAAGLAAVILVHRSIPRTPPLDVVEAAAVLDRVQGTLIGGDGKPVTPGTVLRSGARVSTGAGNRAALRLYEGGSLRLDSNTTLRLVSGAVVSLEQGAIYLDSAGGKGAPLTVRTPAGVVRDVGTQFEARLKESALLLSVREGAASLEAKSAKLEVQAGTRLTADSRGDISREPISPSGPEWDWVLAIAPPATIENRTLGEFLSWVSRETGRPFRFADPARAQERSAVVVHGSLEGLRPDEAPAAILPTCGLVSHLEGGVLVIESLDASHDTP